MKYFFPGGKGSGPIELTDKNFKKLVLQSDDMWLVEFFAPWCGHCKNLEPHWKKAASELKGKVKLGPIIACELHKVLVNYLAENSLIYIGKNNAMKI